MFGKKRFTGKLEERKLFELVWLESIENSSKHKKLNVVLVLAIVKMIR